MARKRKGVTPDVPLAPVRREIGHCLPAPSLFAISFRSSLRERATC